MRLLLGRISLLVALFLSLFSATARSQSATDGAIAGTVMDTTGAVVASSHIVVTNSTTNARFEVVSSVEGSFRVNALTPGSYSVTVDAPGFSNYTATNVQVMVGNIATVMPRLDAGEKTSITVSGAEPPINSDTPSLASSLNQVSISNLPINGRRWSDFATLTPGAARDPQGSGLMSFRGTSSLMNNITIDGADNNQALFAEERGRSLRIGYSTAQAAVQEFQVNTSNYSAEYGRSAGGVVNTITKSGGNQFHGELYFFDRDNGWGATNPYTTTTQNVNGSYVTSPLKPKDWRKTTGFGIGGPILRDRLFFFYAFDYYKRNFPGNAIVGSPQVFFASPTAAQLAVFAQRLGGVSTAQAQATYTAGLNSIAGLLGTVPRTGDQTINFPKLDWQINQKHHATFEYNRMVWAGQAAVLQNPSNAYGVNTFGNDYAKVNWGVARLESILSPRWTNQALFQYGRDFEYELLQQPSAYENTFAAPQTGISPTINILGASGVIIGSQFFLPRYGYPDERRTQVADGVTFAFGRHTLKFGGDYNHVSDRISTLIYNNGYYNYSSVINYLSDYYAMQRGAGGTCNAAGSGVGTISCYTSFIQATGPLTFTIPSNDYSAFVSDSWKLTPRLSLSLGLRYEYQKNADPIASVANPDLPETANNPHDWNNFGPRLGFAYTLDDAGRTVVRGGYGIYYGRVINGNVSIVRTGTGAATSQLSTTVLPTAAAAPVFPNVYTSVPAAAGRTANYMNKNLQSPQIHQFDLVVERSLTRSMVLSVAYLGALGRELPNSMDTNIDTTNTNTVTYNVVDSSGRGPLKNASYTSTFYNRRLNPNYGQIIQLYSGVNSSYNAGVVQLRQSMTRHVQFDTSYTYAHTLDSGQNIQTVGLSNGVYTPFDTKGEHANSFLNVPQRLVASAVIESPWNVHGWMGRFANGFVLAPIFQMQSGIAYTMATIGTPNLISSTGQVISGLGSTLNGSNGANRLGFIGRNTYRYPYTTNVDMRLTKNFTVRDNMRVELVGEAFNLANHQNVTGLVNTGYQITGASTPNGANTLTFYDRANGLPNFQQVTSTGGNFNFTQRQVQLAVRVHF